MKTTTKGTRPEALTPADTGVVRELPVERSGNASRLGNTLLPATDLSLPPSMPTGKLTWRTLLGWLR